MGMDAYIANNVDDGDSISSSSCTLEALTNGENGVEESIMFMEILTRIDLDLAYSSEKLTNLDIYMAIVSLGENQLEELSKDVEIEKAVVFDLSLCYLESEVTVLKSFLNVLRAEITDAHTLGQGSETLVSAAFERKLHASECSLKQLLMQLSVLERQLAIMRGTPYAFLHEDLGSDIPTSEHQKLVLRMLDKSLSGQLDLENQLVDSKILVEGLKLKHLKTSVVVSDLESFVEVALLKLLEADHSSEVYKGIAKEMMTQIQMLRFNIHCTVQREGELKSTLQRSLEQLKEKEVALVDVEKNCAILKQSLKEKEKLEEKVKELEKQLSVSDSKLQEVNEELSMMEGTVESLREHVFMEETRSQSAEDKLSTLTEENIELREELTFLKEGDDNVEKISLLDKQVRDLEVQLQIAKTSAEASIEQQNMLYTAIWDMETLIEELRSKVSKGESRADSAEKQCLTLAELNIGLNKEMRYFKSEIETLKESLKVADERSAEKVSEIYCGAKLVTEMVVELASERERIRRQLSGLARENKILLEELRKIGAKANEDNKGSKVKNSGAAVVNHDAGVAASATKEVVEEPTSTTVSNRLKLQTDELVDQNIYEKTEVSNPSTSDVAVKNVENHETKTDKISSQIIIEDEDEVSNPSISDNLAAEIDGNDDATENKEISRHIKPKYYYKFAAIIILVLSILAMSINWQDIASVMTQQHPGFR